MWGTPTTAQWMERIGVQRAKRMLLTGDLISGKQAVEWYVGVPRATRRHWPGSGLTSLGSRAHRGLCLESAPAHLLDIAFENLLERCAFRFGRRRVFGLGAE